MEQSESVGWGRGLGFWPELGHRLPTPRTSPRTTLGSVLVPTPPSRQYELG